jgi:hypothetical protein
MKKLLIITGMALVCVGAFAQGKLQFATDASHLVYFTTDTSKLNTGDVGVAGMGVYANTITTLAGTPSLAAVLYAGTTAGSLQKVTTVANFAGTLGRWSSQNITFDTTANGGNAGFALPSGTAAFFQIQVYDIRATSAEDAWTHNGWYAGTSPIFTAVPQPASFNPIYATASPVLSTWPLGTASVIGSTGKGAIMVYATVPEPGTFALAGLGLATMMIFRRRK